VKSYPHILALVLAILLTAPGAYSAPQNTSVYLPLVRTPVRYTMTDLGALGGEAGFATGITMPARWLGA
jgi:hypothetical protein